MCFFVKPFVSHLSEPAQTELKELVRQSVEEVLNGLLDEEADRLTNARKYERTEGRQDTRAGQYTRKLLTEEQEDVVDKLKKMKLFETAKKVGAH